MLTYIFYFFLAYMLYQLVFKFIIPIYRTTRQVKRSFRSMQEQMNAHAQAQGRQPVEEPVNHTYNRTNEKQAGEYIDFEEVKD